jgi:hypothetical protein
MKRNKGVLIVTAFFSLAIAAQNTRTGDGPKRTKAGDAYCTEITKIPLTAEIHTPSADLQWLPSVLPKMKEFEPLAPDHERIEKIQEDILQEKLAQDKNRTFTSPSGTLAVTPSIGVHYAANKNNGGTPLDNNIAISNGGILVSVANMIMEVDDSTGHNLYYQSLTTLINDANITYACDPVVVYDKGADRFIFYCQEVTSTPNVPNHMLFFFSKTNNPATGGWNYYKLSGDPMNTGDMADYPKIGITDHDVFVSSNLFNNGVFDQAIVVQIGKTEGYNGSSLNTKVWSGLAGSPFSVVPCSDGQGNSYGPAIWLVATGSGNSVSLYQITNDVTSAPTMNHWSVSMPSYSVAGSSAELGTSETLKIADLRCLSGFYLNGIIHFVFNTKDNSSANTAINYNRLNTSTKTVTNKLFTIPNVDCGYPSIASYTADAVTGDQSVMIGFCQASSAMYPTMSVVSCDNGMNFGTAVKVKVSTSYVSGYGSNRWGDYSGICRRHSSPQACCWMSGAYGDANHLWQGYVAQIYDPSFATGIADGQLAVRDAVKTYPNPVVDFFAVDFTLKKDAGEVLINLFDTQGRVVKELYSGYGHEGENTLSFNKAGMSAGTYFLVIRTSSNQLMHEKIVITN